MDFLFYYVVLLVLGAWMLIRVWRGSAMMGLACLFVPGAVFIALLKNWGDPDTDIKVPFFLSVICAGLLFYSGTGIVQDVVAESAPYYSEADLEELRETDPNLAFLIEQEQQRQGLTDADGNQTASNTGSLRPRAPVVVSNFDQPISAATQRRLDLDAAGQLIYQRGTIVLGQAHASLELPAHFRFVPKTQLAPMARVRGLTLDDDLIGWVVHERIDLTHEQAWFVELRFQALGRLPLEGIASSADLQQRLAVLPADRQVQFGQAQFAPSWQPGRPMATWAQQQAVDRPAQAVAAVPMRHGVLSCTVQVASDQELELALRSARLIATRTRLARGWEHAKAPDSGVADGPSLSHWIAARAKPVVVAEAEFEAVLEDG